MGDDASLQPGALQEVMLHETAVAWCRYKLARCLPARPWLETPEEYRTRLKAAVAEVNATHDVDSLCKELPARVAQLILAEGVAGEVTPWQAPLAAGVYWALQNLPGPRLTCAGNPRQLNHTYFRACL